MVKEQGNIFVFSVFRPTYICTVQIQCNTTGTVLQVHSGARYFHRTKVKRIHVISGCVYYIKILKR